MPGMPYIITTLPELKRLEYIFDVHRPGDLLIQNALTKLRQNQADLVKLSIDLGVYQNLNHAEHLAKDWLNQHPQGTPAPGHWPNFNTQEILHKGMRRVFEEYDASGGIPVEFFWVVASNKGVGTVERFEMSVTRGRNQITAMIHTPEYLSPTPAAMVTAYNMTTTRPKDINNPGGPVETINIKVPV